MQDTLTNASNGITLSGTNHLYGTAVEQSVSCQRHRRQSGLRCCIKLRAALTQLFAY